MQFWLVLIFLGSSLALLVPGACLWDLLFPEESIFERCVWGAACGLAFAVYIAFVLAYWRLSLFWTVWAALSVGVAALTIGKHLRNGSTVQRLGVTKPVLLILGLVAISRFMPTIIHEWPPGWDPSFHLILARKVALADRMIYDWTPFENVPLNYPLGSHFLLVLISRLSGLPLHRVFQMLIPLIGVITTAEVYLLCLRFRLDEEIAAFSALAYGFWAAYGSIDYYRWGGLPNALAMTFLLAIIALLAAPTRTWKHIGLIALFFAAICFAHHHVMITSGIILAVLFVYFLFSNQKDKAVAILMGVGGGVLFGSFYLVPDLLKAASLGSTDVFRFNESQFTIFAPKFFLREMGPVFVLFSAAGLILGWRARRESQGLRSLFVICGTLFTLYLLSGPIYRQLALHFTGQDYVAFTPSRFLMDMACFMSIFAGYAACRLRRRIGVSLAVALVVGVFLGLSTYRTWQQMHEGGAPVGSWGAYQWITENTPPDAIVLNTNSWACFASWRRTLFSPLPISEPRHLDPGLETMRQQLQEGIFSEEALRHELVKVIPPGETPKGKLLWKDSNGWSVVEVWSGAAAQDKALR
jgi:hypothetical protein